MPAEVRVAGPQDWEAWRALRLEALEDTQIGFLETLEKARAKDAASWRQRMADVPCSVLADLVGAVAGWARAYDDVLRLEVHEDNARAQVAYRRLGFTDHGERRPYPLPPGGDEILMVRPL